MLEKKFGLQHDWCIIRNDKYVFKLKRLSFHPLIYTYISQIMK